MSAPRWFGARTLVWLLLVVLGSGTWLMVWYDTDADVHAARLGTLGSIVRTIHATSTVWLVVGALLHAILRIRRATTRRGAWSGVALWGAVSLALISGWMASQTWVQAQILAVLPVPATVAVVVHIAYAGILVLATLAVHIGRWGWRRVLAPGRPRSGTLLLVAAGLLFPVAAPGDMAPWRGVTAWSAFPMAGLWLWPILIGIALAWAATLLPRGRAR